MSKFQSLFLSRQRQVAEPNTIAGKVLKQLRSELEQQGGSLVGSHTASAYVSLESIDANTEAEFQEASIRLESAIDNVVSLEQLNTTVFDPATKTSRRVSTIGSNQQKAGMFAAMLAEAGSSALQMRTPTPSLESNQKFIDYSGQGDYLGERIKPALEAYDETDNRHATAYSIAYNLLTSRQDEFGEAFYPTVVVAPDQVGYVVSIRLVNVMNDLQRDVKGALSNFNKRNIIHAVIDASILDNDSTTIVPVRTVDSADKFVTGMNPYTRVVGGETITTADLAFGRSVELLGISQTPRLLSAGVMGVTDAIDPAIKLSSFSIAVSATAGGTTSVEFIRVKTGAIPLSTFHAAQQGNYRTMRLAFDPQYITVKGPVQLADGTGVSTILQPLVTSGHSVRLKVSIHGSVNLETAETSLQASDIQVVGVYDEDGNQLSLTSGAGQVTAELFEDAVAAGYVLEARRVNSNRRERGQLLTTDFYQQIYAVPLHAPITTLRPVTISDKTDASDLAALVTATHIRTSNAAVTNLIEARGILRDYAQNSQEVQQNPDLLGVANWLVKATYVEDTIDAEQIVDSIKSHERMLDLQSAIVSRLRHAAYTMYRDSGYKAAADALAGGVAPKPTVIIGTDPVIANYLLVNGDFRTLGNDFDVKVVSTLDSRVEGQIFMTFGQFGEGKEGQPNPMHFGNMAWKPEQTIVLPMTRQGQISKELTVQPAFVHVMNLPILAHFTVQNIAKVIEEKVVVNTTP